MDSMNIAQVARNIRGDKSLAEFQIATGINKDTMSQIETGKALPSKRVAKILAQLSGRPVGDFIQ